jgi:hypothetical protein
MISCGSAAPEKIPSDKATAVINRKNFFMKTPPNAYLYYAFRQNTDFNRGEDMVRCFQVVGFCLLSKSSCALLSLFIADI